MHKLRGLSLFANVGVAETYFSFALEDGASVNIDFISMAMKPKKPVSYYRPSQSFDASWIVTDLR